MSREGKWQVVLEQRAGLLELRAEDFVLHEVPGHSMRQIIGQGSLA